MQSSTLRLTCRIGAIGLTLILAARVGTRGEDVSVIRDVWGVPHIFGETLEGGQTSFEPGEEIRGTATWDLAEPPERLEVRLFWYTEGKGDRDVGIVETERLDATSTAGEREFTFSGPEAPLSFSGALISLIWAVEVVALPGEEAGRQLIVISHSGEEIRLESIDPPEKPGPPEMPEPLVS